MQNETSSIVSTIPENTINAVGVQKSKGFNSKGSSRNPCLFCGSLQHSASLCNLFVTVDSRKQAILQKYGKSRCDKCILIHKQGTSCMDCQTEKCTDKKDHGTLACPLKLAAASAQHSQNVNNVNVTNINRRRAVALPTCMALIESSVKDSSLKSTSVLLDTAAQQSLVSRQVVENLGIKPIGKEFTTLVGFGSSKPKPKFYDIVNLTLYKPGFAGKA